MWEVCGQQTASAMSPRCGVPYEMQQHFMGTNRNEIPMKITILGCGASAGVPIIGCTCAVCRSDNPKNKRTRVSILVEHQDTKILVDTSPDLRQQCLANNITSVDAIIYTHDHADHVHGIDDIRPLNYRKGAAIDAYADAATMAILQKRFDYAFNSTIPKAHWFRPAIISHIVEPGVVFDVGNIAVLPFNQVHGKTISLGLRFGDFAYSTDVNQLDEAAFEALEGVKLWLVDCLKYEEAPTHSHLDQTLSWIKRVKPKRAILTHMTHDLEYEALSKQLPAGVEPAHDGLVIAI